MNNYVPIDVIFKDQCTNWQSEKITHMKRTKNPFSCYSSSENINCHSTQAARKKYANNIKHTLDFYYSSEFYMARFKTAIHGTHAILNLYLSFQCIY